MTSSLLMVKFQNYPADSATTVCKIARGRSWADDPIKIYGRIGADNLYWVKFRYFLAYAYMYTFLLNNNVLGNVSFIFY